MSNSDNLMIGPGVGRYLALNRPDTKFDDLGIYKADVVLSADAAAPFVKTLQARAKAHMGKMLPVAKNPMFENLIDDEGNETGEVVFKIRVKNRMNKQGKLWDRRPMVIDAKRNILSEDVAIWGGSVMKVKAEIYEWAYNGKKGISLQPIAVQVIDLKTGSGSVDVSDFDEEEGYEAEDVDTSDFEESTETDENGDY